MSVDAEWRVRTAALLNESLELVAVIQQKMDEMAVLLVPEEVGENEVDAAPSHDGSTETDSGHSQGC
jgi:hypothetical protein